MFPSQEPACQILYTTHLPQEDLGCHDIDIVIPFSEMQASLHQRYYIQIQSLLFHCWVILMATKADQYFYNYRNGFVIFTDATYGRPMVKPN